MTSSIRRNVLMILLALTTAIGAGCGGSEQRAETPSPTDTDRSADDMGLAAEGSGGEGATAEQAPPSPPPVMIVAGEHTPIEGAAPTLRITAPRADQLIRTGAVTIRMNLGNWPLEAPQGPHVHLIVDDEPYIAIRDARAPIDLDAVMQQNLGHGLSEGTHVVRMFPSRGHHESVKEPGAFAMVVFHYRSRTDGFSFDPTAPLLTYSRPKGCNPAGERVLLDFYVSNAELAEGGTRVRWTLDGQTGEIASWTPHFIEHLQEGEHSLQLTLIGADGSPIPGMFNDTTRTFTVASSCP